MISPRIAQLVDDAYERTQRSDVPVRMGHAANGDQCSIIEMRHAIPALDDWVRSLAIKLPDDDAVSEALDAVDNTKRNEMADVMADIRPDSVSGMDFRLQLRGSKKLAPWIIPGFREAYGRLLDLYVRQGCGVSDAVDHQNRRITKVAVLLDAWRQSAEADEDALGGDEWERQVMRARLECFRVTNKLTLAVTDQEGMHDDVTKSDETAIVLRRAMLHVHLQRLLALDTLGDTLRVSSILRKTA